MFNASHILGCAATKVGQIWIWVIEGTSLVQKACFLKVRVIEMLCYNLQHCALATCETSQVLLAGVSGGFPRGSPVFAPPTDWPVSYEQK